MEHLSVTPERYSWLWFRDYSWYSQHSSPMVKICILPLLLAVTPNLHYENYATTTVQSSLFLQVQDWTGVFGLKIKDRTASGLVQFFWRLYTVRSRIYRPDCLTAQTGPDRETVLRSSPKIPDRTAYKSVRSGPVPVPRSSPVSLVAFNQRARGNALCPSNRWLHSPCAVQDSWWWNSALSRASII